MLHHPLPRRLEAISSFVILKKGITVLQHELTINELSLIDIYNMNGFEIVCDILEILY